MYTAMNMDMDGLGVNAFVNPYDGTGLFMGKSRYYNSDSFEFDDTFDSFINVVSVDQFQTDVTINNGTVTGTVYLYGKSR